MPPKRPATSPAMSPSIAKKTRKSLTLEEKLNIIHRYESIHVSSFKLHCLHHSAITKIIMGKVVEYSIHYTYIDGRGSELAIGDDSGAFLWHEPVHLRRAVVCGSEVGCTSDKLFIGYYNFELVLAQNSRA
ncbi:hypothetical protein E2C01_025647 [Portunus trituberculatus]|uniref:Uncharacterized protein n=1 Tax=Portunus trituberculatus TaxID=210409 RepID=A0A5B7EG99_PORTR|nr:hypothetical protein [Portunus trituberculatus]